MRCDSHVHVVGPAARYPQVASRTYLADVAALETLQHAAAPRNVVRFVIVQPSFYGIDNSATLESLDALGDKGRGVVVIDPDKTPEATLADFHKRGVRGLRINLYSPLGGPDKLEGIFAHNAKTANAMGWHVEVIAPIGALIDSADMVARAQVPVVVDHYGLHGGVRPDSGEGRRFLSLLRQAHVWMKLSAPYRNSENALETHPDKEWLAAILESAKDRCVWGSDWPYTPAHNEHKGGDLIAPYRHLAYGTVLDHFLTALGTADPALADRILTDNPARLYGF